MDSSIVLDLGFGTTIFKESKSSDIVCCSRHTLTELLAKRQVETIVYAPTSAILYRSCGEYYYSTAKDLMDYGLANHIQVDSAWPFGVVTPISTQQILEVIEEDRAWLTPLSTPLLASMSFVEIFDKSHNKSNWISTLNPLRSRRDELLGIMKLIIPKSLKIFASRDQPKAVDSLTRVIRYLVDSRRLVPAESGEDSCNKRTSSQRVADLVDDVEFALKPVGGIAAVSSDCSVGKAIVKDTLHRWSLALSFVYNCCYLLDTAAREAKRSSIFCDTRVNGRKAEIIDMLRLIHSEWAANTINRNLLDKEAINGLTEEFKSKFS